MLALLVAFGPVALFIVHALAVAILGDMVNQDPRFVLPCFRERTLHRALPANLTLEQRLDLAAKHAACALR